MNLIQVNAKFEASDEFLSDILCTAIEGGIGWSVADDIQRQEVGGTFVYLSYRLEPDNPDDGDMTSWRKGNCTVTRETVASALSKICDLTVENLHLHSNYRMTIIRALMAQDAGEIDAAIADVIVQVAVFGEVVYA